MKYGFGVDLGGTTVKIAYFDETGNMLDKWEIPTVTAGGGKQILPDIGGIMSGGIFLLLYGVILQQFAGLTVDRKSVV